ncbi:hypothetical protein [Ureibacillus sinduriensis]|uniref:hypothetical protein n=1 Tax=Ureibacillus sinduriensis TaxID=561440 RepID=UPI000B2DABD1|nr:hypothetical protein [Ureibacillus sinduriensis]
MVGLKGITIDVSVKLDEERLQKAIKVFEQEVSECFSIEVGKKNDELPTSLEGSE